MLIRDTKKWQEEVGRPSFPNKNEEDLIVSIQNIEKMLPKGATVVGWQTPDEKPEVTEEMIIKAKNSLKQRNIMRNISKIVKYNNVEVCVADDGTLWYLDKEAITRDGDPVWRKMVESGYPELPQG